MNNFHSLSLGITVSVSNSRKLYGSPCEECLLINVVNCLCVLLNIIMNRMLYGLLRELSREL